ncbi:type VII secretion target [Aldersonia sp. NBC_00410]|uniref:type VII secretion target n=1 Tax=Aldersonia sp. NBC_00410 TaxID=2975954 RepID=UPI00224F057E|nr:type VII secretion target [Aldersonia sp. NBC_00410]MCX5042117.1 type VII secretion target [Aldersonia sp. NBC_00410]
MSAPNVDIRPEDVAGSGAAVTTGASDAKAAVAGRFDSGQAAADGNPGWRTGPALVEFMASFEREMNDALDSLKTMGDKIVVAAQNYAAVDGRNAEALSRIVTALDGLK